MKFPLYSLNVYFLDGENLIGGIPLVERVEHLSGVVVAGTLVEDPLSLPVVES